MGTLIGQAWRALVTTCLVVFAAGVLALFALMVLGALYYGLTGYPWALIGLWPVPVVVYVVRRSLRRG